MFFYTRKRNYPEDATGKNSAQDEHRVDSVNHLEWGFACVGVLNNFVEVEILDVQGGIDHPTIQLRSE